MLDQEDMKESGITETENLDSDLLSQISNITLQELDDKDEVSTDVGVDQRVVTNLLTSKNPVFNSNRTSSKVSYLTHFQL